jgi:ribosomal protein S18 acetylase RimI-like enzyme
MMLRTVTEADYADVLSVFDQWWWTGRSSAHLLHRSFFRHFPNTSFVAEIDGTLVGVLIGFISQARPEEAYIHLVAVAPDHRGQGIGQCLYRKFFETVSQQGCTAASCTCNPANSASIAFHRRMGFEIEEGDGQVEGLSVTLGYAGRGQHRVLLRKDLA